MGVQGLWHLLQPCARPTKLESLEGRRLAIDSSIWLYHFQMAMRDKEGRTLSNAHILGFLWRILKLIHYGIRPIFVFDGGAPVMKRQTLVGRRQRKAGAKDSHQRIAERLLNARLREAAVSHVAGGGAAGTASTFAAPIEGTSGDVATDSHGLGQNTVYFDDLAGGTSSSNKTGIDAAAWVDVPEKEAAQGEVDIEETDAQKKKKRNDWHKDPYALPALERDINTMTATNSTASKNARGGGKRQDVRFATEGELRALLSSIGPTDLDLDSEFFRSLPSELQYELVGDMRAASRGTSYKRLQSMLSQSPTPIDFSRAQIAGLKTRNELTQKVLEVTDEIGDANIKVPIRVAGARNREYVLVRNKGDQGGFALGVRDAGTTQDKAIAVDEDTASATTDDDFERRTTDEDIDLEEVSIEASPEKGKRSAEDVHSDLLKANPNDPVARREVAKELLQRRALAIAKEKAKAQGRTGDAEEMEEQLRRVRGMQRKLAGQKRKKAGSSSSARKGALFRRSKGGAKQQQQQQMIAEHESTDDDAGEDSGDEEWDNLMDQQEAADLGRALDESERIGIATGRDRIEEDSSDLELEEVPTHAFDAFDYSTFYGKDNTSPRLKLAEAQTPNWLAGEQDTPTKLPLSRTMPMKSSPLDAVKDFTRATSNKVERMDPRLQKKVQCQDEKTQPDIKRAASVQSLSSDTTSPVTQAVSNMKWDAKHTRIISISDSDASVEELHNGFTNNFKDVKSSDKVITTRTEQSNLRDGGGNEVKVVDFQDKTVDKSVNTSTEMGSSEKGKGTASSVSASDHGSDTTTSPSARSEATLHGEGEQNIAASLSEREVGPDSIVGSDQESEKRGDQQEIYEDADSPLDVFRRAESAPPSPIMMSLEEDLERETGEKVSFDNITSMTDEVGEPSYMKKSDDFTEEREAVSEVERMRDSEDEHSDYSNKDFGKDGNDSDSDGALSPEVQVALGPDGFPLPTAEELAAMDAEDEAELGEMANDQDEFVSFLSRAKGQGLNQIRKEVEDEVNKLRSEHATTRRTEGEVTIQMAKEIQFMLRLFGLPYITAPMEAEAQCAELIALKLADGIITDDSDVFLFGGTFIYKNMFNNKKYVECYKLADLQHDLGMDRTKLVQLAYLLGSDYTEGLEGVGPVLAMEILSHFPGEDGLVKFREWWRKVQMGQDTAKDTYDSVLRRLKKTLRNKVHLDIHWPDPNVIDAYFEPTVDSSKETFQWGLPDLDSLRSFFKEYLRWDQEKTDHYLIPAIEAQNRRSKRQGTQTTLDRNNFFDLQAGEGVFAGRERPGYHSSRLQQIVNNFRSSNTRKGDTKVVAKKGSKDDNGVVVVSEDEENEGEQGVLEESTTKKATGKSSRPAPRGKAKVSKSNAEKGGEAKTVKAKRQKGKGKRKASESSPIHDNVHDQEWRPAKTKRASKAKTKRPGVTSISQARNMSLDSIANLPPSRVGTRSQADSQMEPPTNLSDDNDEAESSLTEQE